MGADIRQLDSPVPVPPISTGFLYSYGNIHLYGLFGYPVTVQPISAEIYDVNSINRQYWDNPVQFRTIFVEYEFYVNPANPSYFVRGDFRGRGKVGGVPIRSQKLDKEWKKG